MRSPGTSAGSFRWVAPRRCAWRTRTLSPSLFTACRARSYYSRYRSTWAFLLVLLIWAAIARVAVTSDVGALLSVLGAAPSRRPSFFQQFRSFHFLIAHAQIFMFFLTAAESFFSPHAIGRPLAAQVPRDVPRLNFAHDHQTPGSLHQGI